jgi:hypothetical protein
LLPVIWAAADGLRPCARQNGYADFAARRDNGLAGVSLPIGNRFW